MGTTSRRRGGYPFLLIEATGGPVTTGARLKKRGGRTLSVVAAYGFSTCVPATSWKRMCDETVKDGHLVFESRENFLALFSLFFSFIK